MSPKETAYLQNVASLGWLQKRELQCNLLSGLRPNTSESLCPQDHKRLWKNSQRVGTPEDRWWKIKSDGACRPLYRPTEESLQRLGQQRRPKRGKKRVGEKKSSVCFKATLLTVSEETASQNRCPCAQHSVSSVRANYGCPGFMSARQMVNIPPGICLTNLKIWSPEEKRDI